MKIWTVICESCYDCNTRGVKSFSHKPSDVDEKSVKKAVGGMFCISTRVYESEIDGEVKESEITEL